MEQELRECPCCGTKAKIKWGKKNTWIVACTAEACGVKAKHRLSKSGVIKIWNNRTSEAKDD